MNKKSNTGFIDFQKESSAKELDVSEIPEFSPLAYYCKDCKKLVEVKELKKMKFSCLECQKKNIAFGTKRSLINYYKIKEKKPKEKSKEEEKGIVKKEEEKK